MEGYRNFTVTMDHASDKCSAWANVETNEKFNYAEMMLMAAHLDESFPLDERSWFIVFPDGEIALLNEDFDEIMPLFLPLNNKPILEKFTGDEFTPPEKRHEKFCMYCGTPLPNEAVYCVKCGKKVG